MTYECPCGCHIEIADLRRQLAEREAELARYTEVNLKRFAGLESALAEAQQARERAQVAAIEIAKDRAEIKATLGESHALLRRAQEWWPKIVDAVRDPAQDPRALFAAALESYAREERPRVRKRIADCLIGNAFPETQWGKGYCAGILAALTAFDDAIAARIREVNNG